MLAAPVPRGDTCNHAICHTQAQKIIIYSFNIAVAFALDFLILDHIQDQKHMNDRSCESAADEKATTMVLVVFTLTFGLNACHVSSSLKSAEHLDRI